METLNVNFEQRRPKNFDSSNDAIAHIKGRLETENDFFELLIASLQKAKSVGHANLAEPLFNELSWPTDLDAYLVFLAEFAVWIPQQSDHPAWKDPKTGNSQEVYDRLCHFYWLIDQGVGPDGTTIVQNIEGFSEWLVEFANLWGDFLNTPESFNDKILETFIKYSPKYRIQDSMIGDPPRPNNPSGWLTFNQFFARELNPGLRPIASPNNNKVVTMPADCTFRKQYAINANAEIPEITVKKTHGYAKISTLLDGDIPLANLYANGTFVHYFLGPYSYHRFHAPVSGYVQQCRAVQGLVYLEVQMGEHGQFDAPDNAENGYEFYQARGIITIDTTNSPDGNMGLVTVIPVGMCQVSSVNMTAVTGSTVRKGDEFGYFLFGGSDIILLFQEGYVPEINTCDSYRYYGTSVSICPNSAE